MRYLTVSELIYINATILNNPHLISGKQKVRDIDLLQAAAARPESSAFGQDAYPTLREKATALLHSVARNHPFKDGNKRTATVALIFMLQVNGELVNWDADEALQKILEIAQGIIDLEQFAEWLPVQSTNSGIEPDFDVDTQTIKQIISEHHWLLDELDKQ